MSKARCSARHGLTDLHSGPNGNARETRRERRSMCESLRRGWGQAAKQRADRGATDARKRRAPRLPRACVTIGTALGLFAATAMAQADVIISEYVEGASNDKAIELYNSGP